MCGIFGMIGPNAISTTKQALKFLEYRGYDSAGIAANDGQIHIYKAMGRVENLQRLSPSKFETDIAIGHTRWATHGKVCDENAHPFLSYDGKFAIVHNGILDNYLSLKEQLMENGVTFSSQTDSEIIAHLLSSNADKNVLDAIIKTAKQLIGSFAVVITSNNNKNLYAIKNKSPLVVGFGKDGAYLCSDIRCVSYWASKVAVAPDNSVIELRGNDVTFYDFDGKLISVNFFDVDKADYAQSIDGDYMFKEIMEIPTRLQDAKKGYFESGGLSLPQKLISRLNRIYLVGCGTAYHSGLEVAAIARQILNIDVIPVIASEFIYDNYPVDNRTLAVCISQSGETADTIRAAEKIAALGGYTYAVTNTKTSSLCFACNKVKNICAGGEFAVASTKAYNCQLVIMTLMFIELAYQRKTIDKDFRDKLYAAFDMLPRAVDEILSQNYEISNLAHKIKDCSAVFFIGRKLDYPTASEGSLKLKEISYIHSEAYPAGELKHGTLALMEEGVAVIGISTDIDLVDKMSASISEVIARGAKAYCISPYSLKDGECFKIPVVNKLLYGIVSVVPLQLLAYYTAKQLGKDVDKPRNLAKSVTVE